MSPALVDDEFSRLIQPLLPRKRGAIAMLARLLSCDLRLRLAARAFGGTKTGAESGRSVKTGSEHHLITDANGVPLACFLTAANRRHPAAAARRGDPTRARRARTITPPTRHAPRRPRLRLPAAQAGATRPRHQTDHRQTQDRTRIPHPTCEAGATEEVVAPASSSRAAS
jgi:hypothetical protein